MKTFNQYAIQVGIISEEVSKNQKVELSKEQEYELSKKSKLPVKMKVGGYNVLASVHSQARAAQRRNDMSSEDWKTFARKMIKFIETNKVKGGAYVFHDASDNQSVVASLKNRDLSIITIMPKGTGGRVTHKHANAGVKPALMESIMISEEYHQLLDEVLELSGQEIQDIFII